MGLGTVGALIAAVLVLLVALSPLVLFGESLSASSLILIGASLLGAGLLVRWRGMVRVRSFATILASIGGVILILGIALTALLLAADDRDPALVIALLAAQPVVELLRERLGMRYKHQPVAALAGQPPERPDADAPAPLGNQSD